MHVQTASAANLNLEVSSDAPDLVLEHMKGDGTPNQRAREASKIALDKTSKYLRNMRNMNACTCSRSVRLIGHLEPEKSCNIRFPARTRYRTQEGLDVSWLWSCGPHMPKRPQHPSSNLFISVPQYDC